MKKGFGILALYLGFVIILINSGITGDVISDNTNLRFSLFNILGVLAIIVGFLLAISEKK